MAAGLQRTFDILATTRNQAAVDLLLSQLQSNHPKIRDGVFEALLRRRSPTGHREVLRQFRNLPDHWHPIVERYCGRMASALRDAVVGDDSELFQNACLAILRFHEYDLLPVLVHAAEGPTNPNAASAASTVLRLVEQLYQQIAGKRNYHDRRDPQRIRNELFNCLENSLMRFQYHKCPELVEAFLILVGRDNPGLNTILNSPKDPRYPCVLETLATSAQDGILRLLLNFLDHPKPPRAVLQIVCNRRDMRFLNLLLRRVQEGLSNTAQNLLRRIDQVSWFGTQQLNLNMLDDSAQEGLVRFVNAIGIARAAKFDMLAHILIWGTPIARKEACAALADYSGQQAAQLILEALADPSPEVQAQAALQVRQRGLPGTMNRLIDLLNSPHAVVRQAVRSALDDFTFDRYLGSFELLDERIRYSTGEVVRKVDPDSAERLLKELDAPTITARIRAIEMAIAMALVPDVVDSLCARLEEDEDHFVRAAAAQALAEYDSPQTRAALQSALGDRNRSVQEAAKAGLMHLKAGPLS